MTPDAEFAERARRLRATGASISDLERHKARGTLVQEYFEYGYNYRMTDLQAAIGLVQMGRIDAMLQQRREQARAYTDGLAGIEELETPHVPAYAAHAWSSYMVRVAARAPFSRDELLREMANRGVSCRTGIQPLHWEPFYQEKFRGLHLPVTESAAKSTLFLPIFPGLNEAGQNRVLQSLRAAVTALLCRRQ